nr:hypothetical protein [Tanacetum cinerariifolium]
MPFRRLPKLKPLVDACAASVGSVEAYAFVLRIPLERCVIVILRICYSNLTGCVIAPSKQVNVIEILRDNLKLPSPIASEDDDYDDDDVGAHGKMVSTWIKASGWKCATEEYWIMLELSVRYRARNKVGPLKFHSVCKMGQNGHLEIPMKYALMGHLGHT